MSPNIEFEARLLAMSIATGAGLMIWYDLFRLFRLVVRHSWFWIGLEDLIYWVLSGLVVFYLLYRENDGTLRLYVIGTVLVSMVAYDRIAGAFLRKVLKKAGKCFKINISEQNRRRKNSGSQKS